MNNLPSFILPDDDDESSFAPFMRGYLEGYGYGYSDMNGGYGDSNIDMPAFASYEPSASMLALECMAADDSMQDENENENEDDMIYLSSYPPVQRDHRRAPYIIKQENRQQEAYLPSICAHPPKVARTTNKPTLKRGYEPEVPIIGDNIKPGNYNHCFQNSQEVYMKIEKPPTFIPHLPVPPPAPVELIVERQPPVEVRTRTPSENRNFGVTVRVAGSYERLDLESIEVKLAYVITSEGEPKQQILGGRKVVPVQEDGRAVFDNLSLCEASTKHGEKEFCLEFVPLTSDGKPLGNFGVRTTPFYAYSHMKVLNRRKSVKLRTLSKNYGRLTGGEEMHVVGHPFIRGPALKVIFRTPHGDVAAPKLEIYSDSVLFFECPPYPNINVINSFAGKNVEVKVTVQVTNDGRTLSNPLEFVYVSSGFERRF